jgi:hypothetical protein
MGMKALKPWRVVAQDWRGARVTAVGSTTITLSVRSEQHITRSYEVAKALYLGATVNAPCVVKILNPGSGCDNYIVGEVRSAGWAGHAHTSEHPNWGHVEYSLTNESPYYAWTDD